MKIEPGTVAVVTGAGGGLGKALTGALEGRGARVVGVDLYSADRVVDVTNPDALYALAEELRPQVWINNAGILGNADALDQSSDEIRRLIEINLLGVIYGSRAAASAMTTGVILNIGSLAAWNPTPGLAVYSATKHGVRAFSGALAAELGSTNIKVVCLCPDGIRTPMLEAVLDEPSAAMAFSGRRLLDPTDVAEAALRLIEGRHLLRSLPQGRAFLAKVSGLWPGLGVALRETTLRQGRKGQRRAGGQGLAQR